MKFSQDFFKTTSVCAIIAGVLLVIYWLLSFTFTAPADLDAMIELQDNAAYTTSQWVHFAVILFIAAAFWGVAGMKMDTAAGLVTTGFIFFLFDFIPNLIHNSMQIFAFNYNWATKWVAEGTEEAVKATLMTKMNYFYDSTGAVMFAILICFMVGLILFCLATWKGAGLEKVVSVFFFLLFIGELLWGVGMYFGQPWLVDIMIWIVPIVAFVLLFLIGGWLWKGKASAPAPTPTF